MVNIKVFISSFCWILRLTDKSLIVLLDEFLNLHLYAKAYNLFCGKIFMEIILWDQLLL